MKTIEQRLAELEAAVFCGCECHKPSEKGIQLCEHCTDVLKPTEQECEHKYPDEMCKACCSKDYCKCAKRWIKPAQAEFKHEPKNSGCDGCIAETLVHGAEVHYAKPPAEDFWSRFDKKFTIYEWMDHVRKDEVKDWLKANLKKELSGLRMEKKPRIPLHETTVEGYSMDGGFNDAVHQSNAKLDKLMERLGLNSKD